MSDKKFNPSFYQLNEVDNMEFRPVPQLVPKIFPAIGTTLFSGREKSGKSMMMTDLCLAMTHNGSFMGHTMEQGNVLYVALEDKPQRLGLRARQLGYGQFSEELAVAHEWGKIIESKPKDWEGSSLRLLARRDCVGGIAAWAACMKRPRLAIIDTLNCVRQPATGGNQNLYAKDCNDVRRLTHLANLLGIAIVLIHHNNKAKDWDNPNDKISGTTGLPASVDNVVVLYEVQGRQILSVKSRDMESGKYAVDFDPATLKWSFLGAYEGPPKRGVAAEIVQHLQTVNQPATPKEISEAIGYDGNISVFLKRLTNGHQIEKQEDGLYAIPKRSNGEASPWQ